jgi:hypothetical protein
MALYVTRHMKGDQNGGKIKDEIPVWLFGFSRGGGSFRLYVKYASKHPSPNLIY